MNPTLLTFVLAAALAVLAGCSNEGKLASESSDGDAARVVHVHGLGINPKDGALYAATHTGLFIIRPDGTAERVGGSYQDTMAFTVIGPNRFLGSGHPDLRDYRAGRWPALLGLIASDDGGRTWESVSLKGKADFHGLEIMHGQVFGFDSTSESFMVSSDGGKTWDTRSQLPLFDFAVSPDDADSIIGSTSAGLTSSGDGGRTWQPLSTQAMLLVAWEEATRAWALDPGGGVHLSEDGGKTWQVQGTLPGVPEALLDTLESLFVAVREQGIFESLDGGRTWRLYYRDPDGREPK